MKKNFYVTWVVILLIPVFLMGCQKKAPLKTQEESVSVKTTVIKKGNLEIKTSLSGTIKPIEEVGIVSKVPGKVTKVNVAIGDYVKKGDIIFELEQRDTLNGIKQAEATYNTSLANLKRTEEQIDLAKKSYEDMKTLYNQGAISKQQLEQAKLQASETNLDIVKSQVKQAEVGLSSAKSHMDDCIVRAPISGFVNSVNIHQGEMASSAAFSVSIVNMNQVSIETSIAESLINKVHIGDEVDIIIEAIKKDPFNGKVTTLSPAPVKNTLTYPMKITLDNKEKIIKPGMFAQIHILSDKKENVITVPSESVILRDGKQFVFTLDNNRAQMKEVTLGLDNGNDVEVIKGLKEGDILVIMGQNYLDKGRKVKVIK